MDAPRPTGLKIGLALALGCSPMGLWVALNFLRPDLIQPMLDHLFGYLITSVELLLVIGGVLVYLAAGLQRGMGTRVGLGIAGFLLCTLPAAVLMLFGPVVFAFMYGDLAGR